MPTTRSSSPRLFSTIARASALLLLGGAALAACSSDPPAGPGPIPLDDLRDELMVARCEANVRCGASADAATCDITQGDSYETLQLLADAVLGRVTYDPAAARACVEATRARTCDNRVATSSAVTKACDGMFVGTVPEGGPCLLAEECAGKGSCKASDCMGAACCLGTCEKAPEAAPIGADCSMVPCGDDAYCAPGKMEGEAPTCALRKDNGQPCEGVDSCKDGQRCDSQCYVLSTTGQPCNPALKNGSCLDYDDYCDATERKCKQLPGAGQPCADNKCLAYAYCDAGTCKSRPNLDEACSDELKCLGTLACSGMNGMKKCVMVESTSICAF